MRVVSEEPSEAIDDDTVTDATIDDVSAPDAPVDPDDRVTLVGRPEEVDLARHPAAAVVAGVLVLLLFLVAAAGLAAVFASEQRPAVPRVVVPRVAGTDAVAAQRSLESLGLLVAVEYVPNETVPAGAVFGQDPIAGSRLELGTEVTLKVSDGPAGIVVPDVRGVQGPVAASLLRALGLNPRVEPMPDDLVRPGEVLGTTPAAGSSAGAGAEVVVSTSSGPAPRTVPAVVGQPVGPALSEIGRAGLGLGPVREEFREGTAPGVVLGLDPAPGAQVPPRTPVTVVVSGPAPTLTVPSFVGLRRSSAERVVPAGVTLSVITRVLGPGEEGAGRVLTQSVPAGTAVANGTTVQLVVGEAPPTPTTTVPVAPSSTVTTVPRR